MSSFLFSQFLIQPHQQGDAGGFGLPGGVALFDAIGRHDRLVVFLMCLAQFRRHGALVVKIGEGSVRVEGAGVEDGLRGLLDLRPLRVGGRGPGEVVVDSWGLTIIAFQPTANNAHPSHMHIGFHNTKHIEICIRYEIQLITCYNLG